MAKKSKQPRRVQKTRQWYKKEIARLDRKIDQIRRDRFGIRGAW